MIGRQLDVSYIGRQMYGEISIYQIRIQHETYLAANISSPNVCETVKYTTTSYGGNSGSASHRHVLDPNQHSRERIVN